MEEKQTIQNELNELSPLLAGISRKEVYHVPNGYFTELPEILLAAVSSEAENTLPAWAVPSGTKKPGGTVPQGYFEELPAQILDRIAREQEKPRVISLFRKFRFAIAAMVVGIMAVGAWQFLGNNHSVTSPIPEIPVAFHKISDEELSKYADNHVSVIPAQEMAANKNQQEEAIISEEDIQAMLTDYSTEELEKYVKEQHLTGG